jgi:hypothetical protein
MDLIFEKSIGIDGRVFAERRGAIRRRVLKGVVLSFNHGFSSFEGVMRNQSERGGKLSFGEALSLPSMFEVRIAGEEKPRTARVRWRSMTVLGVEFDR